MNPEGLAIEIHGLGPFDIRPYSRFAASADVTYLGAESTVAIGVEFDGRPVGLALAHFVHPTAVRVAALTVEESLRGLGVGRRLLARLEAELVARGAVLADILAANPHPFLEKLGWHLGARMATVYSFSKRVGQAPWVHSPIPSSSYELFPWLGHGPQDRRDAMRQMENDPVARRLSPFTDPARVFGPSSNGIRLAGKLVGWCVTHEVTRGVLQYSSVYVAPEHRRTVAPLILLGHSIREHLSRCEELPYGVQAVPPEMPEIERFTAKRLAPWADSVERIHIWWKAMGEVGDNGASS